MKGLFSNPERLLKCNSHQETRICLRAGAHRQTGKPSKSDPTGNLNNNSRNSLHGNMFTLIERVSR